MHLALGRTAGLTAQRLRSTNVLTKKPIKPSVSARLRLAMGEPTHRSSWPL